MATTIINGDLILDQTSGLQTGLDGDDVQIDVVGTSISGGLSAAFLTYLNDLGLDAGQLAYADDVEAASQPDLVSVIHGADETIALMEFGSVDGSQVFLDDLNTIPMTTVDGDNVFLWRDPNNHNVVLATSGAITDPVIAAFYLDPNATNTSAAVQSITFEALAHPANPNPDDTVDFGDILKIRVLAETNTPIGDDVNVDDDGPSVDTTGSAPTLEVDETILSTDANGSIADNFTPSFGTDGAGSFAYALGISADGVDSGIDDTATGDNILLRIDGDGNVEGYLADHTTDVAFEITLDEATGAITLNQLRAVVHPTNDPNEPINLSGSDLITVTANITDADGDPDSATLDVTQSFVFRDDGPSISANGTPPTLTVDETNFGTDDGPTSFAGIFTPHSGGADGAASPVEITYALAASGASGLTDTLTGLSVGLSVDANGVVLGTITGGIEVFRISIDADGLVTFNQSRAVLHANAADPNDTRTLTSASLIQLTATITDGDGDTAQATANIGTSFVFTDDGPTITAPFDGDPAAGIQRETLHNVVSPPAAAATGIFGYSIGNDIPDYNGADNIAGNSDDKSDFVDGNLNVAGVQLALSGFVGTATPPITGSNGTAIFANVNNVPAAPAYATLVSEDANSATFNFTFHYDKDPITTGIQDATAGGQLIFDKVNDTYSIALNDVVDGFAFDVVHTSQDFARNPNTNSGHPEVVVAQLTPNGDPNPFLVQFTANNSPFSFSQNGEGSTADIAFNGANHDMATSAVTTWVSATQGENGVAGDTIQKGELLTIRFFKEPAVLNDPNPGVDVDPVTPGIQHERTEPTTTASGIVLKFDGIGNAEDLVLILDLVDTKGTASTGDDTETTVALNIQNSDFLKGGAVVPSPYTTEFSLSGYSGSNNDALIIIEQNDYTANANVLIQGVQIMQSANGLTGTGINFVNTTGALGGSLAGAQQNLDPTDNDVLKIVDIGFVQSTSGTLNASLDFAVQLADADGDATPTPAAHILVDVVA
ncbi:DUF5801 repeats-in-toxin domain-containing protein [Mesorhizobium sp.]|uniref:DUF5801 repeats-in-toxin domain-containing protein n=1 Tax=Mesorhizobium sp. TaxID=1871066 RepID=UPI000FE6C64F|nr:DUF5801 repeats-in-toxin domain-containing protein [Mesorhizobium sp.]RWP70991.1 MAG: hypothetical protein EOR09_25090 [Mesorhizobium sp.]